MSETGLSLDPNKALKFEVENKNNPDYWRVEKPEGLVSKLPDSALPKAKIVLQSVRTVAGGK